MKECVCSANSPRINKTKKTDSLSRCRMSSASSPFSPSECLAAIFVLIHSFDKKKLKIAVDGIKESHENKLDTMGNVIFDYRGKK